MAQSSTNSSSSSTAPPITSNLVDALSSPSELLQHFRSRCSGGQFDSTALGRHCEHAFQVVEAASSPELLEKVRNQLIALLADSETVNAAVRPERRLSKKARIGEATLSRAEDAPASLWLPIVFSAALPLLVGVLPQDARGLCVIPHPHALVKKSVPRRRRSLSDSGSIVFDTGRACDNCDKPIKERIWYACNAGCDADFCTKCHSQLEALFSGRDVQAINWVISFVAKSATFVLCHVTPAHRMEMLRNLAFEWSPAMFEQFVKAVADVADAKVVHVGDGAGGDMSKESEFWYVVGFLQMLRVANDLPARELRFGELLLRGPRIASQCFTLGAINKCDATAELERWDQYRGSGEIAQTKLLHEASVNISAEFALFLAHGSLVPIGFRHRCLLEDIHKSLLLKPDGTEVDDLPKLSIRASREPKALSELVIAKFGTQWAELVPMLAVKFVGELGEGPGVTREFIALSLQSMLDHCCPVGTTSSESGTTCREQTESQPTVSGGESSRGSPLWEYDQQLRTYWLPDRPVDAPSAYRAFGVLLGYAVLLEARLPAVLPSVLYSILLNFLGSPSSQSLSLADLASVQPSIARGLQELVAYEGEDIAEVFCLDWPRSGELTVQIDRKEYVDSYVQWYFSDRLALQLKPLCRGFQSVVGSSPFLKELVNPSQLEQIMCGSEVPVDIEAIRSNAEVSEWKRPEDNEYLEDFWKELTALSESERRGFVVFVSACARMPPQGWQDFALQVRKNGSGDERMPTAYTCFNLFLLPRYSTREVLRAKLRTAVAETEGFGLR